MELKHKNRTFEIFEMVEPFTEHKLTADIVSIFEIIPADPNNEDAEDEYKFVDYLCGSLAEDKNYTLGLVIDLLDALYKD